MKLVWVSDSMLGMNRTSSTLSAIEARNVWMPMPAIATIPRTSAVNFAPQMPQLSGSPRGRARRCRGP